MAALQMPDRREVLAPRRVGEWWEWPCPRPGCGVVMTARDLPPEGERACLFEDESAEGTHENA